MAHRRRRSPDSALPTADARLDPDLLSGPPVTFDPLPEVDPFSQDPIENLSEVQDGRAFNPVSTTDASTTVGTIAPTRLIQNDVPTLPSKVGFNRPQEAVHCVRRRQRREVIFAHKYHRRRGGGGGRKRDFWSQFKC